MTGTGNDFLLVDNRKAAVPQELMSGLGPGPVPQAAFGRSRRHDILGVQQPGGPGAGHG